VRSFCRLRKGRAEEQKTKAAETFFVRQAGKKGMERQRK
jgi:hypothetical protein